jgi:hypothetical protein
VKSLEQPAMGRCQPVCIRGLHDAGLLVKKYAEEIYPLNSRSLIYIKVFAHNLFHKICAEDR